MFNVPFPPSWVFWLPLVLLCLTWIGVALYVTRHHWRSRDPNHYDLQWWHTHFEGDSWDGRSAGDDGVLYQYIFYRGTLVHLHLSLKTDEYDFETETKQAVFFQTMLRVAQAYRHVRAYLHASVELGLRDSVSTKLAELTLSEADQLVLEGHRQYAELTRYLAEEHNVVFGLTRTVKNTVHITLDHLE
jgi:hypothetical protein